MKVINQAAIMIQRVNDLEAFVISNESMPACSML